MPLSLPSIPLPQILSLKNVGLFSLVATTSFATFAISYDYYRRNQPDYLDKLVLKRREELLENRRNNDPYFCVKYKISLCEDFYHPEEYIDRHMKIGQQILENVMNKARMATSLGNEAAVSIKSFNEAFGHIAMALAYCEKERKIMVVQQLNQILPDKVMASLGENLKYAFMRVSRQNEEFEKQILEAGRKSLENMMKNDSKNVVIKKLSDEKSDSILTDSIDDDSISTVSVSSSSSLDSLPESVDNLD